MPRAQTDPLSIVVYGIVAALLLSVAGAITLGWDASAIAAVIVDIGKPLLIIAAIASIALAGLQSI